MGIPAGPCDTLEQRIFGTAWLSRGYGFATIACVLGSRPRGNPTRAKGYMPACHVVVQRGGQIGLGVIKENIRAERTQQGTLGSSCAKNYFVHGKAPVP